MDLQFWTVSPINRMPFSFRQIIAFHAPMLENLDFMGIDPVSFTRGFDTIRIGRDGLSHTILANVPRFDYSGDLPLGMYLVAGETLQFAAANGLNDSRTLIWFEEDVPKSTPTNANPITSGGLWGGSLNTHVKYLTKCTRTASSSEIASIQTWLTDLSGTVITPPAGPPADVVPSGVFVSVTPSGVQNGSNKVFTLPSDPNPNSMVMWCFGVPLTPSAGPPGNMEYTLSGVGNRTVTLGLAPTGTGAPFHAVYVTA